MYPYALYRQLGYRTEKPGIVLEGEKFEQLVICLDTDYKTGELMEGALKFVIFLIVFSAT